MRKRSESKYDRIIFRKSKHSGELNVSELEGIILFSTGFSSANSMHTYLNNCVSSIEK